jgi:hypothetical protein
MKTHKMQITSTDTDSKIMLIVVLACLGIAAVPPYGDRSIYLVIGAIPNLYAYLRLRQKAAAAKNMPSQSCC